MKLYRKRPAVVEAVVWDGTFDSAVSIQDWAPSSAILIKRDGEWKLHIKTLEGEMNVSPGDYVIRGVQGEFYPCKPDIFLATYEPVLEL